MKLINAFVSLNFFFVCVNHPEEGTGNEKKLSTTTLHEQLRTV